MKSAVSTLRVLPAILVLTVASWGASAYAQTATGSAAHAESTAATPGPVERAEIATKKAAKATVNAGGVALDATKRGLKKAAAAVTRTGEKIKTEISGTKAGDKTNSEPAQPVTETK